MSSPKEITNTSDLSQYTDCNGFIHCPVAFESSQNGSWRGIKPRRCSCYRVDGKPNSGAGLDIHAVIATKLIAVQGPAMMVGIVFVCTSRKFVAIENSELGFRVFWRFSCTWINNLFFL
jgi:hypothetical protein